MAAGIGNPVGYVPIQDYANPRTLSILARGNISGGAFVLGSSASNTVSSGVDSFAPKSDMQGLTDASGANFMGVALSDIGSNTIGTVARQVTIIALADGTVTAGYPVICAGVNAVRNFVGTGSQDDYPIGRAMTTAGSEGYAIVDILG